MVHHYDLLSYCFFSYLVLECHLFIGDCIHVYARACLCGGMRRSEDNLECFLLGKKKKKKVNGNQVANQLTSRRQRMV